MTSYIYPTMISMELYNSKFLEQPRVYWLKLIPFSKTAVFSIDEGAIRTWQQIFLRFPHNPNKL